MSSRETNRCNKCGTHIFFRNLKEKICSIVPKKYRVCNECYSKSEKYICYYCREQMIKYYYYYGSSWRNMLQKHLCYNISNIDIKYIVKIHKKFKDLRMDLLNEDLNLLTLDNKYDS